MFRNNPCPSLSAGELPCESLMWEAERSEHMLAARPLAQTFLRGVTRWLRCADTSVFDIVNSLPRVRG